ncbi:MAG: beta-lactamase family protein [Pseudooceanicola sp.]|nr:beta-lactamase family protein [Pseudooceanicola sp.]
MSALQGVLDTAVAKAQVPFVVAMTATAQGATFSGAAGEAAPGRAANERTAFRIYSMTKAIGSAAAMILVDRGLLTLDTPVSEALPQWNALRVIEGWDGDTPRLRAPRTQATVRHLMTHTSGLEYEIWNADLLRWYRATGHPLVTSGKRAALAMPLASDPGTRWGYGPSTDWLGQVVEAVDGRRIDAFCRDELFAPLGMPDTAFEPDGLEDRLATVSRRTGDGGFAAMPMGPPRAPEFYGMGHALYSTAPDYLRFLRMVLNGGALDGQRVLSPEAVRTMSTDQMRGLTLIPMVSADPRVSADLPLAPGPAPTHTAAFVRTETDVAGKRHAGSLGWAGICNTHYWIDPKAGIAAVLMTQSLPFLEPGMVRLYGAFERAVYAGL